MEKFNLIPVMADSRENPSFLADSASMDFPKENTCCTCWPLGFIRREVLEKIEMEGLEAEIENLTNKPL